MNKENNQNSIKKAKNTERLFSIRAWQVASYSLFLITIIVWFGIIFSTPPASLQGWLVTLGFALVAAVASLLLGHLIMTLLTLFQRIPELYRWILIGTGFLLFNLLMPAFQHAFNTLFVILYVVIFSSLLGIGIGGLKRKKLANGIVCFAIIGIVIGVAWLFWPGPYTQTDWTAIEATQIPHLGLDDPSKEGSYTILTLTYGSGIDKQRPEYGDKVDIHTDNVDISLMVREKGGIIGWLRQLFWGFDLTKAPLNARVWYPEGTGPFPLVLIVHGNHSMDNFSDPGYDYLGELLATRGYIVASIDQNFLNGAGYLEAILGGLENENDARAYLLLQHLALWHQWNETEHHIFEGKIDTDKIALIGHSRGGEAAAIAGAFNPLPAHPDNAMIPFDFGFNIGGVIAIAPSDGQYQPRRMSTRLEDVSYLVLQGSIDSDVSSFVGSRQYDRVKYSGDEYGFKAAIYIHNANHGQFNSRWGRIDQPGLLWFLNRNQIMSQADQEAAAKVFISSFLEASLHGHQGYETLFQNPLLAQTWLPCIIYLSEYQSSDTLMISTFDEDLNIETTTIPGGKIEGINLSIWREQPPVLGRGQLRNTVSVRLGWNQNERGLGVYSLELPSDLILYDEYMLTFALVNLSRNSDPLDFTIRLTDRAGEEASLPLSHIMALPTALTSHMLKPPLRDGFDSEPVFQTYSFKLEDFMHQNYNLDLSRLQKIDFIFDITPSGSIYLDDIGFRL